MTLTEGCGGAEINESYLLPEKCVAVVLWDAGAEPGLDCVTVSVFSKTDIPYLERGRQTPPSPEDSSLVK